MFAFVCKMLSVRFRGNGRKRADSGNFPSIGKLRKYAYGEAEHTSLGRISRVCAWGLRVPSNGMCANVHEVGQQFQVRPSRHQ